MPFFAQVVLHTTETQTSDYDAPLHFASWMACLFFLLAIGGAAKYLFAKEKPIDQPFRVKEDHDYVTVTQHKEDMGNVNTRFNDLQRDAATGRSNLHVHMEAVKTEMNGKIDDVKSEMADLPEKTINLLLKTKELNR